ncbi:MAG: HEAT repeat domain-containing protein [Verrucomicrobia bacterium]|nr:HEAT repeat domain-containing protein [Verrucomicrobiota bacterium]
MKHAGLLAGLGLLGRLAVALAQDAPAPVPAADLTLLRWAREPQVMDPVALSFDDQGVLFVAETARRGTVDIDIRSHRTWLVEDLSNQSVDDLRAFFRRRMAPEQSQENASWLRDLTGDGVHDWQDLIPVKERIRRLEDADGQGRATRSQVFVEGFNEEISGVVAGVLAWQGQVFVTGYPELKRFPVNSEGLAGPGETVFRGFGVHAAFDGHDLHGLIVGPDGKIYFTCGDNGFSVTTREGKRLHYPNTGGVLRMNPDGSNLEVFATGLRNPQEIAFDEYGNWFAVDNDGDLRDERERFVHIAEGSDSGWRLHWQFREPGWAEVTRQPNYNPWVDEHMWVPSHPDQPAFITPPITNYSVGPGSFVFNPGTALNESYQHHFFLIQFPVQKVTAFQTVPHGAGFAMVNERSVLTGMMASAVAFGPDGGLYVADWDGMWNPNGTGSIWRLDDPKVRGTPVRNEVQTLLRQGFAERSSPKLIQMLGHADQRIRLRAQFELVRRGALAELQAVVGQSSAPQLARIHALWGITQLRPTLRSDQLPWADADPLIRGQVAKAAGELRLADSVANLETLLKDANDRVRFQAALALGKLGEGRSLEPLVALLAESGDRDPFLRHAACLGLAGLKQEAALGALTNHPAASVRVGAVVALRRLQSPLLAGFLRDSDRRVRREAARAIHDDAGVPAALPSLAALLDEAGPEDEVIWRRAISANLRLGTEESGRRLLAALQRSTASEALRLEALEALAVWNTQPSLDRVEGQIRPLSPRPAKLGVDLLAGALEPLWAGASPDLAVGLVRVVLEQQVPAPTRLFADCVAATNQPPRVRAQALQALDQRQAEALPAAVDRALMDSQAEVRRAGWEILARRDPARFLQKARVEFAQQTLRDQQWTLRLLGGLTAPEAGDLLASWVETWTTGGWPQELNLDLWEAVQRQPDGPLKSRVSSWVEADPARRKQALLAGGDSEAGRRVFRSSVQGQCGRCHDAGGEGLQAGPVLAGIGQRVSREYLLEALLDPSARLADGYGTVRVTLKNGEDLDGLRLAESAREIRLRLATGEVRTIPVTDIQERSANPISVMPPMGDVMSPRELRDLVAFLSAWK